MRRAWFGYLQKWWRLRQGTRNRRANDTKAYKLTWESECLIFWSWQDYDGPRAGKFRNWLTILGSANLVFF